jgi:hypothetical protein
MTVHELSLTRTRRSGQGPNRYKKECGKHHTLYDKDDEYRYSCGYFSRYVQPTHSKSRRRLCLSFDILMY